MAWKNLQNLILVPGHAVYIANNCDDVLSDNSWYLQDFQKGEPPLYIEHIKEGIEAAHRDPDALLVISGGQSRIEAGPHSEAESYMMIAEHYRWWWNPDVKARTEKEEFARDSFENLLFGICRFYECCDTYPEKITVVGWAFKKERFELHRQAIRFPKSRFSYISVNNPYDSEAAAAGEKVTLDRYRDDPYGVKEGEGSLSEKRTIRNPFNKKHQYGADCPELAGLLQYRGIERYEVELPWEEE